MQGAEPRGSAPAVFLLLILILPIHLGVFIFGENPNIRIVNTELQIIDVFTEA